MASGEVIIQRNIRLNLGPVMPLILINLFIICSSLGKMRPMLGGCHITL
jgi:hypothetical protein